MGDARKGQSSRKPVSLNDSHYRFLQELSTPRPPCPEEENQSMAKVRDSGCFTMPSFSLFGDIDSPSQKNEVNQPTVKPDDHTATVEKPQYCGEEDNQYSMPTFSLGSPFQQNEVNQYSVKPDGHTGTTEKPQYCGGEDDSKPTFSLGSPFEQNEVNQYPVKPDDHTATAEKLQYNCKNDDIEPTFSLGSPFEQNEAKENPLKPSDFFEDNSLPSSNETTDSIDLSKQIEDQKVAKVKIQGRRRLCKVTSTREGENIQNSAALDEPGGYEFPDFESPQRPPANKASEDGNEIRDILNDLSSRLGLLSIEKKRVPKKVDRVEESVALKEVKEVNEADLPDYASAGSSFSRSSGECDTSLDSIKKAGGSVEDNLVDEYEEREEDSLRFTRHEKKEQSIEQPKFVSREAYDSLASLGRHYISVSDDEGSESEAPNVVNRTHGTLNNRPAQKKSEPIRVGQSSKSNIKDEVDNDCVVVSSTKVGKKGDKFIRKGGGTDVGGVLDVDNDEPVPEFEGSLTLRGQRSTYTLPGKIAKMLYPHQREGLRWLWSLHCKEKGGILGDDMGLGKTMQICGFLAGLFHSHLIKRALVVAPKTLLAHWVKELSVVGLSEKTREYYSTCPRTRQYELQYVLQDKGILLTTYDIVRNNVKSLRGDSYLDDESDDDGVMWDYMILDEGHLIKNPSTQRAKSLLEIPSPHRIIISGTPLQNNLKELWALFNFCCPELLGDKKWFKDKYEHFILRGSEKKASDRDKRVGSAVAKELRERIQPYFLRRLKSEVFNDTSDNGTAKLSKKNEVIVWLRLTNCQRQLYEAFLKSELVLSAFDGSPLAALTILKKICDHPLLLTKRAAEDLLEGMDSMLKPEDACIAEKLAKHIADVAEKENFEENHDNISCKISFIMSLLDNLIPNGHNVLIFSQTRKMLNLIQESLASSGYEFLRIDGTTKASDRVKIVDEFQGGNSAPIFLLTSQVGGLGLTLTNADRVIVVDPAWNPSMDNQSVDRAYRIGQRKDVLVYRLMTCGTVEEKIYRKQIFKGGLFKTATEHKEQIRYFSQQDLCELFSLPAQGFDVSLTQQQLHEEHDSQHKMDESLQTNVQFLETLGIAGVSHHSLLFSKTAPVPVVQEEEKEEIRSRGTSMAYRPSSSSSSSVMERPVDGAEYAFNPKDVKLNKKPSPDSASAGKRTESEIKDKIKRLALVYENKAMVSRLADKGEKIKKQISELNLELDKIKIAKRTGNQVIDLDCLTGELQKGLNL